MRRRWRPRSVSEVLKESRDGHEFSGLTRKLIALARPYRRPLAGILALQVTVALLEAVTAALLVPLMQVLLGGAQALGRTALDVGPLWAWSALVRGGGPFESQLRRVAMAFLIAGLLRAAVQYTSTLVSSRFSQWMTADLRRRLLELYMGADYQFFLDRRQGRMINDLADEPERAVGALGLFLGWGQQFLVAAGLTVVLLTISWQATLAAAAVGLVITVVLERLRLAAIVISKESLIAQRQFAALVAEVLSGIRQIKLFGAEGRVLQGHGVLVQELIRLAMSSLRLGLLPGVVAQVIGTVLVGGALLGLTLLAPDRAMALFPALAVFILIAGRLLPAVANLSTQRIKLLTHSATLDFVLSCLQQVPDTHESRWGEGRQSFAGLSDRIEFDRVTFGYRRSVEADVLPTRESWLTRRFETNPYDNVSAESPSAVLQDVRLVFKRGERTAIVGPSGGGKSTIVDLLVRLFEPQGGRIAVDGVDLREYDIRSWRACIGYVSQDTFLFHGTIRDNVAFGKPDATLTEVQHAARMAHAHDFILALPDGYDTVVGDRGLKLSGGQRQRVAIARAVLRDPPILVFDEATSSLDTAAERAVQAAIDAASRNRTVIVVAHRLSTVIDADRIYVLDRGLVLESGRHEELLAQNGEYRRLYAGSARP